MSIFPDVGSQSGSEPKWAQSKGAGEKEQETINPFSTPDDRPAEGPVETTARPRDLETFEEVGPPPGHPVLILGLIFWICTVAVAGYMFARLFFSSSDFWDFLHEVGSAGMLLGLSATGLFFDRYEATSISMPECAGSNCMGRLAWLCRPLMNLFLFLCVGCFLAAGPWSQSASRPEDSFVTSLGRVLCVTGILLGGVRLCLSCWWNTRRSLRRIGGRGNSRTRDTGDSQRKAGDREDFPDCEAATGSD
mmetsp:Transcript_25733/g.56759  ORF Transcript_25733/g.56759 Transcript_25733/m.56759 type:complete len:249 (+) Transcript_25733:46-792(+)